jgi:hypothetical protein
MKALGALSWPLTGSVADLDELTGALTRISQGGTVFDPKLVVELCSAAHGEPTPSMRSRHENERCWR